mmetsp:Transcript_21451/g.51847  ORF Transcript_21451/g.51847 Transcript_21451/m.51847 type:complete len:246 (+) Transcript_21451:1456-2193(+)
MTSSSTPLPIPPAISFRPAPPILPPTTFHTFHLVPPALVLGVLLHVANEAQGNGLDVHEVAESPPAARVLVEIPASGLPEIRHGAEFHLHLPPRVVPSVHHVQRVGGLLLLAEFGVDVPYHVIPQIVADVQGLEPAELGQLVEEILEEEQEALPRGLLVDLHAIDAPSLPRGLELGLADGMTIDVLDEYGLREGRAVMDARTAIGVTARSYFEVEGTVHLVLFRSVNACQMPCHYFCLERERGFR